LAEAIRTRRIQCLVFPMAHDVNVPALSRLALPTATMAKAATNRVDFDQESLLRDGVRRLARQGCRSIGLVTNIGKPDPVYSIFRKAIRDEGLRTRGRWIRSPSHSVSEPSLSRYGYTEFKSMWELRDKPDGLIVYPDAMVNGVIMAVLEAGRSLVTEQMKFLFHRNSKISVFCPFPVTWAISDEEALAEGLIDMIYRQFAGEKITPVFLPYVFHDDAEARSKHR
jgi:DNA-binding LacI/PurR family transcriptional regulator